MAFRFQLRRDTAINWEAVDPVLLVGELAYETDTGRLKLGDGTSTWSELPYFLATVESVNGQIGIVLLDTDDIAESGPTAANKWFTPQRVANTLVGGENVEIAYDTITEKVTISSPGNVKFPEGIGLTSGAELPIIDEYGTTGSFYIGLTSASSLYRLGVGTTGPRAVLEVTSTDSGILFPRLTELEKNSMPNPIVGMVIYQTDAPEGLYQYKTGGWETIDPGDFSGTANHVTKFTAANVLGNSIIYDDGTSVSIGASGAHPSALFQLSSTSKGFLSPKMSEGERNLIPGPTSGLLIYNISTNKLNLWDGSKWAPAGGGLKLAGDEDIQSLPLQVQDASDNGSTFYLGATSQGFLGNLGIGTTGPEYILDVRGESRFYPDANTTPLTISGYSLTGTNTQAALDISGTWNTTGTPTLIRANVTDTASNTNSLLMDLLAGGTSQFRVSKSGGVNAVSLNTSGSISADISISSPSITTNSILSVGGNDTSSSGIVRYLGNTNRGFAPISGNAVYNNLEVSNTINQTGGANGITRGLYINPTLTSAADWRSIEWSNNSGWGLYGGGTANNYLNGNLFIGTTTNAGFKLDVSGSGRFSGNLTITGSATNSLLVRGSGTTSATTAFTIQNSASTNLLQVRNDNSYLFGSNTSNRPVFQTQTSNPVVTGNLFTFNGGGGTTDFQNVSLFRILQPNFTTNSNAYYNALDIDVTTQGFARTNAPIRMIYIHPTFNSPSILNETIGIDIAYPRVNVLDSLIKVSNSVSNVLVLRGDGRLTTSGSITAASALAQGVFFNNTLVAAANNDVLVGLDINPTFTNGAFTGVNNIALRSQTGKVIHQGLTAATQTNQVYYNTTTGELTYGALPVVATPTLDQVTTAGNTTTNSITVGGLTVATNLIYTDTINGRVGIGTTSPSEILDVRGAIGVSGPINMGADPSATTQSTAVIRNVTTNSGIAIVPNGTGAITASIPDGTTTGGNARGIGAVDLQRSRTANTQVALNKYSFIGGGRNNSATATYGSGEGAVVVGGVGNTATGNYVFIGGGSNNSAGGNDNYQIIVGGLNNAISAAGYSFIGGGQNNSISAGGLGYNIIVGGASNSVTSPATYATISGGQSNTASTNSHATVVGGQSNVSSGQYSISGGFSNVASAQSAIAIGHDNDATAISAFAYGRNSVAYLYGQSSNASAFFTSNGDAQQSLLTARKLATLNSAGTTILSLDGTGTTNLIIPNGNNRAWNVTIEYVAVCTVQGSGTTVVGDVVTGTDKFRFKRVGGTSTIGAVTNIELTQDATMTASTCTYAVGTSNSLQITFVAPTTANATTFRVVAKVSLVEVAW